MQHISRTASLTVNATPDVTLPLFTAKGECLWIADWKPTYIYPESGDTETGMIWKTSHHGEADTIWVTVNYDAENHLASYIRWTAEKLVTRIDIKCDPDRADKTRVHVTYTLTAIAEAGHATIDALTEAHYTHMIASWEEDINHYLANGEIR